MGSGDNVLIMIHDIFGFDSGRTKLICDELSLLGITVYQPDFYRGEFFDPFD